MRQHKWSKTKIWIFIISILIVILTGVIIYNVCFSHRVINNPYVPDQTGVENFSGEQLEVDEHIDGDVDTTEEYQFMLQSAHGEKGKSFVFVSQTETTITFHLVNDSDKKVVEIYVMDKKTLEVTISVPPEESK